MAHITYIRDDQRIDLCLSHENKRVVVRTPFEQIGGVWVNTRSATHFHKADVVAAEGLLRKFRDQLEDDGFKLVERPVA